jgi:hypothetical protein
MMRRFLSLFFLLLPTLAMAQPRRGGDFTPYPNGGGCIGGTECRGRQLRVALEDRPVVAVRFHAHDQVGAKADGRLRVKIDGNTIRDGIDVQRRGETYTIDVEELRGRYLVFEAASDDEVMIDQVAVLYGSNDRRGGGRRDPWDDRGPRGNRGGNGWRQYPRAGMCIGGDECRKNGTRITVALEDAPVLGIRFWAHDQIGTRADGRLSVRIDETSINSYIDVQRAGKRHEIDVENVRGSRLVISTSTDDEVEVSEIEVLYGDRRSGGSTGGAPREQSHEGGCIGGNECGGRRARIRIALRDYPVSSIRFYARDDVGTRAGGELRIRIDDEVIEEYLDIPREGKTFTFPVDNIRGEFLIFEPTEDDEVVVRDVKVRYEP